MSTSAIELSILNLVFLASLAGQAFWLRPWIRLQFEFWPLFIVSSTMLVLFFGGLIHQLDFIVWIIYILGLLGFVLSFPYWKHLAKFKWSLFLGGIVSFYFLYFLRNQLYIHFDNFTHWGWMIQTMLKTHRLPNATDVFITYTSYPPGTALFSYYTTLTLMRSTEGVTAYGQSILILASIFPLLHHCTKTSIQRLVLVLGIMTLMLTYNTQGEGLNDLLVDGLLGTFTFGIFAQIWMQGSKKEANYLVLGIPLTALVIIKNSAVYFVLILVLADYWVKEDKKNYREFITLSMPMFALLLWSIHTKLTFTGVGNSMHAMSINRLISVFQSKGEGAIFNIIQLWSVKWISPIANKSWVILALMSLLKFFGLKDNPRFKSLIRFGLVSTTMYGIGLLGLYLFSMPTNEAIVLAGIDRYLGTHLIFLTGLLALLILEHPFESKTALLILPSIVLIALLSDPSKLYRNAVGGSIRENLTAFLIQNEVPKAASYIIEVDEHVDAWYVYFLSRYLLNSSYIMTIDSYQIDRLGSVNNYYYWLRWNRNERLDAVLEERGYVRDFNVLLLK